MLIFEVITPGTWLESDDRQWAFEIEGQLRSLTSQFYEANLALNLFMAARESRPSFADQDQWERDAEHRARIRNELELENQNASSREVWEKIQFETEVRFKREKWQGGSLPREFEHGISFIYAKAFLYALDAFDKFLGVLARERDVPEELPELHARIGSAFPNLRGVRNTSQHLEDRARGLGAGRNPQPMNLQPVENNLVSAPAGGVLILNSLNGSRFGSTMADGHFGEVDVSPESLEALQHILNDVLQAFSWQGPVQHGPSA